MSLPQQLLHTAGRWLTAASLVPLGAICLGSEQVSSSYKIPYAGQTSRLSSYSNSAQYGSLLMGSRDPRTRRGKIFRKSNGKCRPKPTRNVPLPQTIDDIRLPPRPAGDLAKVPAREGIEVGG